MKNRGSVSSQKHRDTVRAFRIRRGVIYIFFYNSGRYWREIERCNRVFIALQFPHYGIIYLFIWDSFNKIVVDGIGVA